MRGIALLIFRIYILITQSHRGYMIRTPRMTLLGIVLDSPDAQVLSAFYRRLLGWTVEQDEPYWVKLSAPGGGSVLFFQSEVAYV